MKAVNCLIIDDEELAIDIIEEYVSRIEKLKVIGRCSNAIEALQYLNKQQVDLLFLDIQMPGLTGLELIKTMHSKPEVIFTTAYSEYALEGFELDALDYLVKPISFERFITAINKYFRRHEHQELPAESPLAPNENAFIFVKSDKAMVKVLLKQIIYIESLRNYVSIYLVDGREIKTMNTISKLEEKLPASHFIRIHRSFIICFDKIDSYMGGSVQLCGHTIPIGRNYKDAFRQLINDKSIE
ncbi:LytR/AlgR family response regulator transcription factor [Carboxylicivirga taeanensis]|uniref:LytR/AlgR family response regulator transcription factor n=1 Tax=Carboxylicivirga taeanensis TaxID=1416875 RepID=UPI003F6E209E